MLLENRTVLVTGASRGIGKAIALKLAQEGAFVIGTATSKIGAESISTYLSEANLSGCGKVLDVANIENMQSILTEIKNDNKTIEILVNNAGITCDNLFLRMKDDEWQNVIDTNLTAIFRLTKACLRDMIKARWGRIINITSVVGITGNPGQANYVVSKAGLIGLTKTVALEIATRGVTVNAIAPGFIATDMTAKLNEKQQEAILKLIPMNKIGAPEDIAATALFLASPAGNYITGQTIHVNGGMYMV